MEFEGINIEYKSQYTESIKKTVIAFANTSGGSIYIGIKDDLTVIGIGDPDETILKITNMIRDSIRPDATLFVRCQIEMVDDKNVVVVEVQPGTACPYYIGKKGIRPEGVFIRHGASTIPATETHILNMIKSTSGDNYEEIRSLDQELNFITCMEEFSKANVRLEEEQMRSLKLINYDGQYNNLAVLLSEECKHTIKIAVFQGKTKEVFKDRHEFTGSLFKQLYDCYGFIERYNSTRSDFEGLVRKDYKAYPEIAIREALLNAIIHREYSLSASTLVSLFDNRIEFVTVGGLLKGISIADMKLGVSLLRNQNLANIFYRLKLIEAYGTGVIKILESYNYTGKEPLIEVTENAFKITLYNNNYIEETREERIEESKVCEVTNLTDKEKCILENVSSELDFTRKDIEELLDISTTMAMKHLKNLTEKGVIVKINGGKNTSYKIIAKDKYLLHKE